MSKIFDFTTFVHSQTGERTPMTDMTDMLAGCTPEQAADYQQYIDMLVGDQIEDQSADAMREAYEDEMYELVLAGELAFDSTCSHQVAARRRYKGRYKEYKRAKV